MQFLSEEWAKAYSEKWNSNEDLKSGLKKFNGIFQYQVSESDITPLQIEVKSGEVVKYGAPVDGAKIEFDMWASLDGWRQVIQGEKSVKMAMMSPGFGFKGSKIKAAMHMGSFEKSIQMMGEIDTTF